MIRLVDKHHVVRLKYHKGHIVFPDRNSSGRQNLLTLIFPRTHDLPIRATSDQSSARRGQKTWNLRVDPSAMAIALQCRLMFPWVRNEFFNTCGSPGLG